MEAAIAQTRKIELLSKTHKDLIELYKRLNDYDDEIDTINFDLNKRSTDVKIFIEGLNDDNKNLFDDLVKKVKKIYKKIDIELREETDRLEETGKKLKNSPLSDADKVSLKKDMAKCKAILETCKA